jgi:hypothetical protein
MLLLGFASVNSFVFFFFSLCLSGVVMISVIELLLRSFLVLALLRVDLAKRDCRLLWWRVVRLGEAIQTSAP